MPDLDADRSAHDHHCFSTGHPEEFPETFRDKQPAASRQLQLTVTAGAQPAKLLEVGDLLFQFPRFELAGHPVESVGQLLLPGISLPEPESSRAFLGQQALVACAGQASDQFRGNRKPLSLVPRPPEFAQQQ